MKVLAHDPFPAREWAQQNGVEYVDGMTLVQNSDVISLHTPLTPETKHIIRVRAPGHEVGRDSHQRQPRRSDRYSGVDPIAQIRPPRWCRVGRLRGRGRRVLEDLSGQVLQDDDLARLLTFPNVLITSHQAFLTREALSDIARTTVANLQALGNGQPLSKVPC